MKYTYTGMKDDACYEGLEPDESWKPNVAYGYELDYHENIGALYGTYSLDMKMRICSYWTSGRIYANLQ